MTAVVINAKNINDKNAAAAIPTMAKQNTNIEFENIFQYLVSTNFLDSENGSLLLSNSSFILCIRAASKNTLTKDKGIIGSFLSVPFLAISIEM